MPIRVPVSTCGFLGILCLLGGTSCSEPTRETPTSGSLRVVGSDVALPLVRAEADTFMVLYPKSTLQVEGGGTLHGIEEFLNGRAPVAVLSRDLTEQEKALAEEAKIVPQIFRFAVDGLAVIVHRDNPVETLGMERLADLFGGRIKSWKELGGPDVPVVVVITTERAGSWEFFRSRVLGDGTYGKTVYPQASEEKVVEGVSANVGAIGYAGMSLVTDKVRAVALSARPGLPGVKPSRESVLQKEYPLIRFFSFCTRSNPTGLAAGFVSYVTSAEGQKMVVARGYLPATMPVRVIRLTQ